MRAPDSNLQSNIAASSAGFPLIGGQYLASVVAAFGGGSISLQRLGPDGSTYLDLTQPFNNAGTEADLVIGQFKAAGAKLLQLAPGTYRWAIATAAAVYAEVVRTPGE